MATDRSAVPKTLDEAVGTPDELTCRQLLALLASATAEAA